MVQILLPELTGIKSYAANARASMRPRRLPQCLEIESSRGISYVL